MTILIISEPTDVEETYIRLFSGNYIEERDDLAIVHSYEEAETFINHRLRTEQKHIDFIFANIDSADFLSKTGTFGKKLRKSNVIYSSNNFQLKSIPIILFKESYSSRTPISLSSKLSIEDHFSYLLEETKFNFNLFDGVLSKDNKIQPIGIHNNVIASSIDRWLNHLNADLDNLNIDNTEQYELDLDHFERVEHKIKILSNRFHQNPIKLDYLWARADTLISQQHMEELLSILKKYEANPKLRDEKKIHDYLRKADYLLKGENYYKCLYEKHFYTNERYRYVESDFINFIHPYSLKSNEIYEVKLPSERFTTKTGERRILKMAQRYFKQIGEKYNNYFHDPVYLDEIKHRLAEEKILVPNIDFRLTLLMGREIERQDNLDLISKNLAFGQKTVKLITYDNLIDKHSFLMQRVKRFGLR